MRAYRVEVEVKTKYVLEVHAEDEAEAAERASNMDLDEIEANEFGSEAEVTNVGDIYLMYEEGE